MRNKKARKRYGTLLLPMLCLALLVGAMATGVTYSSYVTGASGSDSIAVAKFDVDIVIGNPTSEPNGEKAAIPIKITNNSEVTVEYDVVLKLPNKLPSNTKTGNNVVCSVNGKQGVASADGKTITISDCGTIAMGNTVNTALIIYSKVAGSSGVSDLNSLTYKDATVAVQVTQAD